jgi:hypothetical protein
LLANTQVRRTDDRLLALTATRSPVVAYGSWMNLVERWFSALVAGTRIVWTRSAERILERIADYGAAINAGA